MYKYLEVVVHSAIFIALLGCGSTMPNNALLDEWIARELDAPRRSLQMDTAYQAMLSAHRKMSKSRLYTQRGGEQFDISHCQDWGFVSDRRDRDINELVRQLDYLAFAQVELERSSISRKFWEPIFDRIDIPRYSQPQFTLDGFVRVQFSEGVPTTGFLQPGTLVGDESLFVHQVASALNQLNAGAEQGYPEFVADEGCGGPRTLVSIETVPPDASVSYISRFRYDYCIAVGFVASDSTSCKHWYPFTSPFGLELSGEIYISVKSNELGRTEIFSIDLEDYPAAEIPNDWNVADSGADYVKTISIDLN